MTENNPYAYSDVPGEDRKCPEPIFLDQQNGHIEFRPEKYFHTWQIFRCHCVGVVPGLVVGICIGGFIVCIFASIFIHITAILTGLIFLAPALLVIYFMPFWGYPNCFVRGLVHKFYTEPLQKNDYLCQFTTSPSRYRGFRALIENADDLGVLRVLKEHLLFEGDHTTAVIPYHCIQVVLLKNAGYARGMWLGFYLRIYLSQDYDQGIQYVQIGERQKKTVWNAYKTIRQIQGEIEQMRGHEDW